LPAAEPLVAEELAASDDEAVGLLHEHKASALRSASAPAPMNRGVARGFEMAMGIVVPWSCRWSVSGTPVEGMGWCQERPRSGRAAGA
jgi:hypothetical protein